MEMGARLQTVPLWKTSPNPAAAVGASMGEFRKEVPRSIQHVVTAAERLCLS
jgi:hypothetical protein